MSARHRTLSLAAMTTLVVTLATASCGGGTNATTAAPTRLADGPRNAAQLFVDACASCHGPLGQGGWSGVPLNEFSAADRQLITRAVRRGVGAMPASSDGMSDEQIDALVEYVAGLR